MKIFRILILCLLSLSFGNYKGQKTFEETLIRQKFNINFYKVLKNYSKKRLDIQLNNDLKEELLNLKKNYGEKILQNTKNIFSSELTENVVKISYLKNYPDINAVLLNKGNFLSTEKQSEEDKQKYAEKFVEISKLIPNDLYLKISEITDEINKDKMRLIIPYKYEVFQDFFDENARKRTEIINFLLWNLD